MGQTKRQISKVKDVISEIAHDLGIDKALVKEVLLLTFKEIAITLVLKGRPVMIRRFVKFVVAAASVKRMRNNKNKKDGVK
tara:strand:- start:3428 stop:3670 length:243 start_codon:yes stop_codon:yes gene_type:complete